jgi:predicted permease
MPTMMRRLFHWLRLRRLEDDLAEEISAHREMKRVELERAGVPPHEAGVAVARELGNATLAREQSRDVWVWPSLDDLLRDVRFGVRMLFKNKGFAVVAIITLALGIGGTTAIYSIVDRVLVRALPYDDPDRLVWIYGQQRRGTERGSVTALEFLELRRQSTRADVAAVFVAQLFGNLSGPGSGSTVPARLRLGMVTGNYFRVLGTPPMVGRGFVVEDEAPERSNVVVISASLFYLRFSGNPDIVGREVMLDSRSVRVLGVMPPQFRPPFEADIWVPMPFHLFANQRAHNLRPLGRLTDGVTLQQAQAESDLVASRMEQTYPSTDISWRMRVVPMAEALRQTALSQWLRVVFGAVLLVLLVTCANLGTLLLSRAEARRHEMVIRSAVGAGRPRLVRQVLVEMTVLVVAGCAGGVLVAYGVLAVILALAGAGIPAWAAVEIDARVLGIALAAAATTAYIFGIGPAIRHSRPALNDVLKSGASGAEDRRSARMRSAFVVAEVMLAVILLVGAGLFARSLRHIVLVNPGFQPERVLTFGLSLPEGRYKDPEQARALYEQLDERLRALPTVESVGQISILPLSANQNDWPFTIEGQPRPPRRPTADHRRVDHEYLATMRIPLLRGRQFSAQEARQASRVTIIDETFARRFFGDANPIGQRLVLEDGPLEIVGVAGPVLHRGLAGDPFPTMYVPSLANNDTNIVVRTTGTAESITSAVREAVAGLDRDLPISNAQTAERLVSASSAQWTLGSFLLGTFAALALILAVSGLYGVTSTAVVRRTREIGIRLALGSSRAAVLRLVLRRGTALTLAGLAGGLLAAVALSRFMTRMLYDVTPGDPLTYSGIAVLLLASALVACWIPARRAARMNPVTAVRYE